MYFEILFEQILILLYAGPYLYLGNLASKMQLCKFQNLSGIVVKYTPGVFHMCNPRKARAADIAESFLKASVVQYAPFQQSFHNPRSFEDALTVESILGGLLIYITYME